MAIHLWQVLFIFVHPNNAKPIKRFKKNANSMQRRYMILHNNLLYSILRSYLKNLPS